MKAAIKLLVTLTCLASFTVSCTNDKKQLIGSWVCTENMGESGTWYPMDYSPTAHDIVFTDDGTYKWNFDDNGGTWSLDGKNLKLSDGYTNRKRTNWVIDTLSDDFAQLSYINHADDDYLSVRLKKNTSKN